MLSAAELLAMSDNDLIVHLNGGFGPTKRNQALAGVRNALRYTEERSKAVAADIVERHRPENLPKRASEQGGSGSSPASGLE